METTRQRRAFDFYWELGARRSLARLQERLVAEDGKAPSMRTLFDWSSHFHWQQRLARLELEARMAEDEVRVQAIRDMYERQAQAGVKLIEEGLRMFASLGDATGTHDSAIRAIVEGAKLERIARGEPSDRREVMSDVELRLREVDDEQLAALLEFMESRLEGDDSAKP